jgi:hypothetical protein
MKKYPYIIRFRVSENIYRVIQDFERLWKIKKSSVVRIIVDKGFENLKNRGTLSYDKKKKEYSINPVRHSKRGPGGKNGNKEILG